MLELGVLLAGSFAGRLLAEMGAEVIKIEAPGVPDPLRSWGQTLLMGKSLLWGVQSRNKKCITLNLRHPRGQDLFVELVRGSDVVLENFRPGTLERWNVGYDRLSDANPGLVLTRISGYGQTGPYSARAGFASVAEAMAGLRYINGFPDEPPPRLGVSLGDSLAGMFAFQGTLAALYEREASPEKHGQVVDVSLLEACFALLEGTVPEYHRLGIVREPSGTGLAGIAPSNIFKSRDGKWMVIAANQDNVFSRLCEAMEAAQLADDPRFADHVARGRNQEALEQLIAGWAAKHDAGEIDSLLNDAGVVCGPIYTIADIFADPHFLEREMLVEHDDPVVGRFVGPGITPKFSRTPGQVAWTGPWDMGSHNDETLGGLLGLDESALAKLRGGQHHLSTSVLITEVGPRDGLQNQSVRLTSELRASLIDRLSATGLKSIEAVSFANPKLVPQMGGAEEVTATMCRREGVLYAGLVMNEMGYERFRTTPLDVVRYVFAASETFNQRNANTSVSNSMKIGRRVLELARGDGTPSSVTIGAAFGCPFEGPIPGDQIVTLCETLASAGWDEIILADTIGVAVPRQVATLVRRVTALGVRVGVHLHNTRNTGFVNALAAIESGALQLDSSIGGVGGCPFAPPSHREHRNRRPCVSPRRRRPRYRNRPGRSDRHCKVAREDPWVRVGRSALQGRTFLGLDVPG